jgi:hypothetical protein
LSMPFSASGGQVGADGPKIQFCHLGSPQPIKSGSAKRSAMDHSESPQRLLGVGDSDDFVYVKGIGEDMMGSLVA